MVEIRAVRLCTVSLRAFEKSRRGSWVVEVNGVVENLEAMRCELEAKPSKQLQSKVA